MPNDPFTFYSVKKPGIEVEDYLARIGFTGEMTPTLAVLSQLQRAHLMKVPFENLDIHNGRRIELEIAKIFEKIVKDGRGGFCYELNGLFFEFLRAVGFDVTRVSGRVFARDGNYGAEFDHLAIIAKIDDAEYLVDVGFGKFALEPIKIEFGVPITDELGVFQFDKYDDEYWRVSEIVASEAVPQYIFKPQAREFSEFAEMCNFHQTSPLSHFTRGKVISILTPEGRITLTDKQLKIQTGSDVAETEISLGDFNAYLENNFRLKI